MSEERGIIQHLFIQDRNNSNKICYICGEAQEKHLNESNININNNNINGDINIEIQNEVNEINQSGIRNNSIGSNNHTINMKLTKKNQMNYLRILMILILKCFHLNMDSIVIIKIL